MNLFLASGNSHKAEEFQAFFKDLNELSIEKSPLKVDVVEDGSTYYENAFKKAEGYYQALKKPVLADDSGLDVEALPNDLGIHSARYGGEGLSDADRAKLLLKSMVGITKREAKFTCVLCLYISPEEHYFFEGHLLGRIHDAYTGDQGFGYDPVFVPLKGDSTKSIAEQSQWKSKNSHRAAAVKFLMDFFQSNVCQN